MITLKKLVNAIILTIICCICIFGTYGCNDSLPLQMTHTHEELKLEETCEICNCVKHGYKGNYSWTMVNQENYMTTIEIFDVQVVHIGEINTWSRYVYDFVGVFISKKCKRVEMQAFFHFEKLKYVVFENDSELEYIGAQAFHGCRKLKTVELPKTKGTLQIASNAFDTNTTVTSRNAAE